MKQVLQGSLFDESSPADQWDKEVTRRALDELFILARQYRSTVSYYNLLAFVARFRFYSPYNAMLIHIQMPGAQFVAPPQRWLERYHRRVKSGARPIVILRPMGPVMFVFDVSDTEPEDGAPPLPPEVEAPFEVRKGKVGRELRRTIENAKRDGVQVGERSAGAHSAGQIHGIQAGKHITFQVKERPNPEYVRIPLRYGLLLNSIHSSEAKYATLVHELGHLYCGHLGSPNEQWWSDRRGMSTDRCEFEAESVCYLVCARLGIDNPSDEYLSGYMGANEDTPEISLECVMKSAGLIEQMGRQRLRPRTRNG